MGKRKKFGEDPGDRIYSCALEKSLDEMPVPLLFFLAFLATMLATVVLIAIFCGLVDLLAAGGW